jgi:hypothetical protein
MRVYQVDEMRSVVLEHIVEITLGPRSIELELVNGRTIKLLYDTTEEAKDNYTRIIKIMDR